MFGDFAVVRFTEVIERVGRTKYGERERRCWVVQTGKTGERLHNDRLCWASYWEGGCPLCWLLVQAPSITEARTGLGVDREERGKKSAGGRDTLRLCCAFPRGATSS